LWDTCGLPLAFSLCLAGCIGFLETQTWCSCQAVAKEFLNRLDTRAELVFFFTLVCEVTEMFCSRLVKNENVKTSRREVSDLHSGADEYARYSQYLFIGVQEVQFVSVHAMKSYDGNSIENQHT
jgi:hypothetical protein